MAWHGMTHGVFTNPIMAFIIASIFNKRTTLIGTGVENAARSPRPMIYNPGVARESRPASRRGRGQNR